MNAVVEKFVQPVVTQSLNIAAQGVKGSRRMAEASSDWIGSSTDTVSFASDKILKLNKISHGALAKLVKEQGNMMEGTLKAVARRLDVAANANSFQDLWADQMELMPKSRQRISKDARKVIDIFAETRDDISELIAETIADFSDRGDSMIEKAEKKATKTRKAVTKKATRVAKTAKKNVKKKTRAVKKTAKKKATRARKTVRKTTSRRR